MSEHERETWRSIDVTTMEDVGIASNLVYCLRGLWYYASYPVRRLLPCRVAHLWCACCSPSTCVRCGAEASE